MPRRAGGGSKKAKKEPQEGRGAKKLQRARWGGDPLVEPRSSTRPREGETRAPGTRAGVKTGVKGGSTEIRSLTPQSATGLLCSRRLSTTQTLQHPQGSMPWNFPLRFAADTQLPPVAQQTLPTPPLTIHFHYSGRILSLPISAQPCHPTGLPHLPIQEGALSTSSTK